MKEKIELNKNAFDLVGLIATCSVLLGHTIGHSGIRVDNFIYELISPLFTPGEALAAIFAISGFLVAASWERSKSTYCFIKRRVLKIYPALFLVILFPSIIYIATGYVESSLTSYIRFFIRKLVFSTGADLVPAGAKGNVSLWTIVLQMQFYILTPIIVKFLKNKNIIVGIGAISIFVIYNLLVPDLKISNMYLEMLWYDLCFPYLYMYLVGVVCYLHRDLLIPFLSKGAWWMLGGMQYCNV